MQGLKALHFHFIWIDIMNKKTKDLILAFITLIFGIYITFESYGIYKTALVRPYNVEKLSLSPGFLPLILGILLIFFSLLLIFFSLVSKEKKLGETVKEHIAEIKTRFHETAKDPNTYRMVIGMIIMFIFSFFLVGLRIGSFKLPFYISGGIFMFALLMYLGAVKWWQSIIITVITMLLIVVLFQYGFRAILP